MTVRSIIRGLLYPKGSSPLKWKELMALFISLLPTAMTITMVSPFLPAMVKFYGKTEEETGYYVGFIVSSLFFGRFLSSYFWGVLADKIGRKPVIISSLLFMSVSNCVFGLSTSVTMAVVTRFIVGLVNGVLGTGKAVISELCDSTNQSLGMSMITIAYSSGFIIGPAIGGFLSEVGLKYPHVFPKGSFFAEYPFFLPCIINSVFLVIGAIVTAKYLSETLQRSNMKSRLEKTSLQMSQRSFVESETKDNDELCTKSIGKSSANLYGVEDDTKKTQHFTSSLERKQKSTSYTEGNEEGLHLVTSKTQETVAITCNPREDYTSNDSKSQNKTLLLKNDESAPAPPQDEQHEEISENTEYQETTEENLGETTLQHKNEEIKTIGNGDDADNMNKKYSNNENIFKNNRQEYFVKNKEETKEFDVTEVYSSGNCGVTNQTKNVALHCKTLPYDANDHESNKKIDACCWFLRNRNSNLQRIMSNRNATLVLLTYSLFGLCHIAVDELIYIWAAAEPRFGGLGFDTDDMGTFLLVVGIVLTFVQIGVLPKVERSIGCILNLQGALMISLLFFVPLPALRMFVNRPDVLWPLILVALIIRRISTAMSYLSIFLMLNNSVKHDLLCSVNGLGIMWSSLSKSVAPTVAGSLFSWSISSGRHLGFPFNVNMAFIFFGIVTMTTIGITCYLSNTLNMPFEEENVDMKSSKSVENVLEIAS